MNWLSIVENDEYVINKNSIVRSMKIRVIIFIFSIFCFRVSFISSINWLIGFAIMCSFDIFVFFRVIVSVSKFTIDSTIDSNVDCDCDCDALNDSKKISMLTISKFVTKISSFNFVNKTRCFKNTNRMILIDERCFWIWISCHVVNENVNHILIICIY